MRVGDGGQQWVTGRGEEGHEQCDGCSNVVLSHVVCNRCLKAIIYRYKIVTKHHRCLLMEPVA